MVSLMNRLIFFDIFESGLPKKHHGNAVLVLHEIKVGSGRFSTFEMSQQLMYVLNELVAEGKIKDLKSSYPWHTYKAV